MDRLKIQSELSQIPFLTDPILVITEFYRVLLSRTHSFDGSLAFFGRQQVDLVEDDQHAVAGDFTDDETLGRLRLHALGHVDHQHHHVDDLRPWFGTFLSTLIDVGIAITMHYDDDSFLHCILYCPK